MCGLCCNLFLSGSGLKEQVSAYVYALAQYKRNKRAKVLS